MNSNYNTSTETVQSPGFESWVVAPKIIVIPGDATPQYNASAKIDVRHQELKAQHRDLDGKFSPVEKPVTRKQAIKKLDASSQSLSNAIDRLNEMENW